jgi:hypothetical protein
MEGEHTALSKRNSVMRYWPSKVFVLYFLRRVDDRRIKE